MDVTPVVSLVERLRNDYEAPLVVAAKPGSFYDISMLVGAQLTVLREDVYESAALDYLEGMLKGFQFSSTRSGGVETSDLSFTHLLDADTVDRKILLPIEFNGIQSVAIIVEVYTTDGRQVFDAVTDRGKNNSGQQWVRIAILDESVLVRVVGL